MFERGVPKRGEERVYYKGMWPVQEVESIASLLALMKIQAYE